MKGIFTFSLLLAILSSSVMFADPHEPATNPSQGARADRKDFRDTEREARQLAEELLDRRQIAVRVYKDWQADPAAFKLVSIPLSGLTVPFTSIESAFGQMSDSTVIVALGEDQKDEVVAAAMEDFIYAELCRSGSHFSIWPERFDSRESKWWLFKDILGNPIANAAVQIFLAERSGTTPKVWIKEADLDEEGRLKPFKVDPGSFELSFTVSHPDYNSTPAKPSASHTLRDNEGNKCYTVPVLPKDKWCVFNDALGEPIPAATVKIFNTPTWKHEQAECMATVKLDERGRLEPPASDLRLERCCFVVSHPDYGTALAEPRATMAPGDLLTRCTVPLVRIGARADKRSIWGTVVDTQGNPVKGALLTCTSVRTLDGARISIYPRRSCRTITNELGKFAMHVPLENGGDKTSTLIPVAADYSIQVAAPRDRCLGSCYADVASGEETTITLPPAPSESYFPTLIFEDEFGPVTDPNMLKHVRLKVERSGGGSWHPPTYNDWMKIGRFEPGTYYATADWNGRHYACEPVDLTREWPDTVVFKMKLPQEMDIIYQGQVVHGVTGQPVPEAIVMTCREGGGTDVSHAQPEQWDAIHAIGPKLDPEDPALAPLKEGFTFTKITRTDAAGRFYIVAAAVEATRLESFVAIKRNYLGAEQRLRYFVEFDKSKGRRPIYERFEPDENDYVTLPPMKLFPAGTILVEPNTPDGAQYDEIRLSWFTSRDDTTPWLKDLWAPPKGGSIVRRSSLQPNKTQTAYVAAGVDLTIEIRMLVQSQWAWAPIVIHGIRLQQGQVLDLGRLDFQPNIKVAVKVINSAGEPVGGVTVHVLLNGNFWGQKPITNKLGLISANVPPHSKGEFGVAYYDKIASITLREAVPYEVAGEEDAGRQFTLQLSDEMVSRLFE